MLKRSNKRRVESAYTQHHSVQQLHARHSLRSCHPGQASRSLYRSAALPVRNSNSVGLGLQPQQQSAGSGYGPYPAYKKKFAAAALQLLRIFFSKRFKAYFLNFVAFSTKIGSTSDKACVRLVGSRYVHANVHRQPRSRF